MIESPEAARAMAWPMLLQAVREDLQLLLSLPLAPFTYHVVLAKADGDNAKSSAKTSVLLIVSFRFITVSPLGSRAGVRGEHDCAGARGSMTHGNTFVVH